MNNEETTHHKYSPSRLESLSRCCHYVGSEIDSEAAERGTLMHKACEQERPEMIADEDDRTEVMKAIYTVQQLSKQFPGGESLTEVELTSKYNHGTADRLWISEDRKRAMILDFKFGYVEVTSIQDNLQLANYAVNAFAVYPLLEECTVAILQPACSDEVSAFTYQKQDMAHVMTTIEAVIDRANHKEDYPHTPDTTVCQWCANKAACPAWTGVAITAGRSGYGLPLPGNWQIGADKTPEDRARLQILGKMLTDQKTGYFKLLGEETKDFIAAGGEIPGFVMRSRAGNWKVIDEEAVRKYLLSVGMTEEDIWSFTKISVKKAVEALAANNSMLDAGDMMEDLAKFGACERGNDIRALYKTYKGGDADKLKEIS